MHLKLVSFVGLLVIGVAQAAAGQQPSADASRQPIAADGSQPLDVNRLPVDLAKITRQLRVTTSSESHTALHIRYTVDVYGASPRIEFFSKADNLQTGPVPYGGPTHLEMINHVTPQEYRAPGADFSALLRWLADRGNKK